MSMLDLIKSLEFVGRPSGEYVVYHAQQTSELYYVTWYANNDGVVRYNILSVPELIAVTAKLAITYNREQRIIAVDDIITELFLPASLKYHIDFIRESLIKCLDRLN